MKVIGTDNHDSETVSDTLVCENVNEHFGKLIVEALNRNVGDHSPTFYKLVPDEHVLYTWEP